MTVKKTLSINDDLFAKLDNLSNKYFQGNISATVVFILCKYFENYDNNDKEKASANLIHNLDFLNN